MAEAESTFTIIWTGSVSAHPAYRVLYKKNHTALMEFITHAKGMTYEEAEGNQDFMNGLLNAEKGDAVAYQVIEANLPRLSQTKTATKDMAKIVEGFEKLLELRKDWLTASVRYWVSDCWLAMVRGYFVSHDDAELTRLRENAPKLAQDNFAKFQQQFSNAEKMAALQSDIDKLRARAGQQLWLLIDHKKTMQAELGTFKEIDFKIDEHFVQLATSMYEGKTFASASKETHASGGAGNDEEAPSQAKDDDQH